MVMEMMVFDNEAPAEVNQEVDKEVTKVVEQVDKELVNKGLALVCRYGDGHRGDFFKDKLKSNPSSIKPGGLV